jgi:hypothetical protein
MPIGRRPDGTSSPQPGHEFASGVVIAGVFAASGLRTLGSP